jgi:hypothetical protein
LLWQNIYHGTAFPPKSVLLPPVFALGQLADLYGTGVVEVIVEITF